LKGFDKHLSKPFSFAMLLLSTFWSDFFHNVSQVQPAEWLVLALASLCVGMAKTGIPNLGMATVPLVAWYFGGKLSTGIMLPMLIVADTMAVLLYYKLAEWRYYFKLIPWTILGVLIGTWLGMVVSDAAFKQIMALIFGGSLAFLLYRDYRGITEIPTHWFFSASMGILAGITTMFGNLAGAAATVFLLAMRLPKWNYIGTSACFFFTINLIKTPLQVFFWKNISWETVQINLCLVPVVILGGFLGWVLARKFSDRGFRRLTLFLALVAMVLLLV
jgi:uncharacterized protein